MGGAGVFVRLAVAAGSEVFVVKTYVGEAAAVVGSVMVGSRVLLGNGETEGACVVYPAAIV